MSHRLTFSANTPLPIATKLSAAGAGRVVPASPCEQVPRFDPRTHLPVPAGDPSPIALAKDASIELLALDVTPLDQGDGTTDDLLWVNASFTDPLGRFVELCGHEAVPKDEQQHFGAVAARTLRPIVSADDETAVLWEIVPLVAWGAYDVRVDGELTDLGVVGLLQLIAGDENSLDLILFPRALDAEGRARPTPIQAAEELGAGGFRLVWRGVDYVQVPVMTVRAERGDTLASIANEMSVDPDTLARANPAVAASGAPLRGELVHVPFIVRAATAVARRVRSTALSWKEIIRGWTTLN